MSDLDTLLNRALQLGEDGEWDEMARTLADALDEGHADDPYVLVWLGVAERQLGNEGAAYERFRQALAQQPEDPLLLATAGTGLAAFDDPEAEGVLRTAAMMAPEVAQTRVAYGAYLSREGFFDTALTELEAARALEPDDVAAAVELGIALALKGDMAAAGDVLDQATRLDPGDGWLRTLLGLVLLETGQPDEAAAELARAARTLVHDPEVQLLAALSAGAAGWDDAAYEMLERARHVAEGRDLAAVEAAQDRIDDGAEACRGFLTDQVAPGALRQRLMERP